MEYDVIFFSPERCMRPIYHLQKKNRMIFIVTASVSACRQNVFVYAFANGMCCVHYRIKAPETIDPFDIELLNMSVNRHRQRKKNAIRFFHSCFRLFVVRFKNFIIS